MLIELNLKSNFDGFKFKNLLKLKKFKRKKLTIFIRHCCNRKTFEKTLSSVLKKRFKFPINLVINFDKNELNKRKVLRKIKKISNYFKNPKVNLIIIITDLYPKWYYYFYLVKFLQKINISEYLYVLEDDDDLKTNFNFLKKIKSDFIIGFYIGDELMDKFSFRIYKKNKKIWKKIEKNPKLIKRLNEYSIKNYQFGMVIFKLRKINFNFKKKEFKSRYFDWKILQLSVKGNSIKVINTILYKQNFYKNVSIFFNENFEKVKK